MGKLLELKSLFDESLLLALGGVSIWFAEGLFGVLSFEGFLIWFRLNFGGGGLFSSDFGEVTI